MRISDQEARQIKNVFKEHLCFPFELRLFGSRANDKKLGGDIDLLIIVNPENLQHARDQKFKILNDLYDKIGEQKIDMLIITHETMAKDQFLNAIQETVEL